MTRLSSITVILILFGLKSFAQSSARASVSVTFMDPVGIQMLDPNTGKFSCVAKPKYNALQSSVESKMNDGCTPGVAGTSEIVLLHILNKHYSYSVTIPPAITVIEKNNKSIMTVGSFQMHAREGNNSNSQILGIDATICTGDLQSSGEYVSMMPLQVTINYN